jgi:hypothetical protein
VLRPARTFQLRAGVAALAWAGPSILVTADRDGHIETHRLPDKSKL